VWLIDPDGRLKEGAAAIFRALSLAGKRRAYWWGYRRFESFRSLSDNIYEWIADHRDTVDRFDRWFVPQPSEAKRSYVLTQSIFLRALGVVYLVAFLSLWVQIHGLVGKNGILPVELFLKAFQVQNHDLSAFGRFMQIPTLCWIDSSDQFLGFLCAGGVVLSTMLILGFLPVPVLCLLWLFYLSLVHAGQTFLGFQWDSLLLETGVLAVFFAPLQLRLRPAWLLGRHSMTGPARPSRIALFLLRWLLFRVMFLSGAVKWLASVPAWRDFTAMRYHYQTQPLPTWTSWYANLLPDWFQALSVGGVFFIEGLVPILFFGPRIVRLFAFTMIVFLQLLIAATGNFGFFNLLAIVLCLVLLDDAAFARFRLRRPALPYVRGRRWPRWILAPVAVVVVLFSLVPSLYRLNLIRFDRMQPTNGYVVPTQVRDAYAATIPFELFNGYGLFQDMTTRRPELIVEGSDDGVHWLEYQFKWKPGDVKRRPQFCSPHMPRLDWQMWFAALTVYHQRQVDIWLGNFPFRLHENSPQVLNLLESNPFPNHPPKYVRVALYDYHFTNPQQRAKTGAWWQRQLMDSTVLQLGPPTDR
jgi:hypothetical protein